MAVYENLTPCIEWTHGYDKKQGYGRAYFEGVTTGAHRVAYCIHHGIHLSDIAGVQVRHKCDNPSCVNPDHLEIGTNSDNVQDRLDRGRQIAKLSEEQVMAIRSEYIPRHPEFSSGALAKKYGVSGAAIRLIVSGATWKRAGAARKAEIERSGDEA